MKNILVLTCALFCLCKTGMAQNLVPNPNFEQNTGIPMYRGQLYLAAPWRNPTDDTPDYFHEDCPLDSWLDEPDVPENQFGYQYARSGKALIALHTWTAEEGNIEFAQVELTQPLQAGREYKVEAWISRGDYTNHSTNCHGFLFTETIVGESEFLGKIPQINNLEIVSDAINWVKIGGEFVPDKNYKVMTIGNFFVESPPFILMDEPGWYPHSATYYWDDISVELIERQADFDFNIAGTCLPATVNLSTQPFFPGDDIAWKWNDGAVQTGENIEHTFEEAGTYTVELTITHNTVKYSIEKEVVIDMPKAPIASFEIKEEKLGMKKEVHLENGSQYANLWLWDFGDGATSDEETPIYSFDTLGNYRITLIASNELGCTDTAFTDIYVPCADRMIFNAFTPNDDGQNDVLPFDRIAVCDGPISINIFNRWGNLVYESDDPTEPWRAENVSPGTYYFLVSYKGGKEEGYIDVIK